MVRKIMAALLAAALVFCVFPRRACGFEAGAKGAVVMDAASGRVLYEKDAHKRLPMASTTKIMTALLTLEQPNLDEEFTVDAGAIHVEGSSMGLTEGDTVTLRALAAGMLLASGNDAAGAAAVRISGSMDQFVEKMNERARQLGMVDTSFETPSGLDGDAHYSTAYDMALLARAALENTEFAAICGQYRLSLEYGNPPYQRQLRNHNRLLNEYEGTIGVKTGFTKAAGRCLVSAARREGVTLICVTLSCSDDWNTHKSLLDEGFARYPARELSDLLPVQGVPVGGGVRDSVAVECTVPLTAALEDGEAERLKTEIMLPRFLLAPVGAGRAVGQICVTLDGEELLRAPLVTAEAVAARPVSERKPGLWENLKGWIGT